MTNPGWQGKIIDMLKTAHGIARHHRTDCGSFLDPKKFDKQAHPSRPQSPRLRVEDDLVKLLGAHGALCEGAGFDNPVKQARPGVGADLADPILNHQQFLDRYFLRTSDRSNRAHFYAHKGTGKPSLFAKTHELQARAFREAMSVPTTAASAYQWILLLSSAASKGKNQNLEWKESSSVDSLRTGVDRGEELAVTSLADKKYEGDLNRASQILDGVTTDFLRTKANLTGLLHAQDIRSLTFAQKLRFVKAMMQEFIYQDYAMKTLKAKPDFASFVSKFNELKDFPTATKAGEQQALDQDSTAVTDLSSTKSSDARALLFGNRLANVPVNEVVDYEQLSQQADQMVAETIAGLERYIQDKVAQGESDAIERLVFQPFNYENLSHEDLMSKHDTEEIHPQAARDKLISAVDKNLRDDTSQALINLNHLAEAYVIDRHYLSGKKSEEIKALMKDMALSVLGHQNPQSQV